MSFPDIRVYPDHSSLAKAAVEHIIQRAGEAISQQGYFAVLLSGGSTPQPAYLRMSQPEISRRIDWQNVHLFWGDERCVHPNHADSNFNGVHETLLAHVSVPEKNIHRIRGEYQPAKAAEDYESEVRQFFQRHKGRETGANLFDLALLGLGEDGHTASLFPGSPALKEIKRWFVRVEHNQPPPPLVTRITATLPLINSSTEVVFMVTGKKKSGRVREVILPQANHPLPAQLVQPASGRLLWFLDQEAAVKLPSPPH